MKRKILILLLILTLIPSVAFAAEKVDFTITGVCDYPSAYKVLEIVNEERQNQGLQPLSMNETLLDAAMQRAAEIAFSYYPAHCRPDGTSWGTVIGDSFSYAGENIAAGQKDSEDVMNSWMNSEGHRANILNGNYNTMGVGCFYQRDIGRYTWVQIFTSSKDGGYVRGGTPEKTFTITALTDRFDIVRAYNPSASYEGISYYTHICPGKTEEFRVIEMEPYDEDYSYPTSIPDMDNFSFKALSDNITVDGHNVTVISKGEAKLGIYIGNVHIGTHTFKAEHYWYEYDSPATCTNPGYTGGKCMACGHEEDFEYVPALGHDAVIREAVEPTCTKWGLTEGSYCGRCGLTLVAQENVPALGHKYINKEVPATCTEYGLYITTCERCSFYQEFQSQSPLGHWWGDPCDDEDNYDRVTVCETCEYKEVYKKGYERLNSDVKSFMNIELKPTHEETVMKYKAIYDNFSDEYKAEFLYEEELNDMVRYFEFFHMGDADRNGKIGAEDLSVLLSWYGGQYHLYDITGDDDIINSDDLSMMLSNYGKTR